MDLLSILLVIAICWVIFGLIIPKMGGGGC